MKNSSKGQPPIRSFQPKARTKVQGIEKSETKMFVLDTNVLMHDPTSLFQFEEHDIYIPIVVLEELDHNKKGMTEVARSARQVSRFLDELIVGFDGDIKDGIPLASGPSKTATGRLHLQTEGMNLPLLSSFANSKADNQIIAVAQYLRGQNRWRNIILVSKDINMRIKARVLNISSEDYFNDKVLEDTDILYSGMQELSPTFWKKNGEGLESWKRDGLTYYRVHGSGVQQLQVNECLYDESGDKPLSLRVKSMGGDSAELVTLNDYTHQKHNVWGITARNREQNFALNLLMDHEVDFVTLLGQAGTGKTLLTLAAALTQTLDQKLYSEIIVTRVTIPVGEDIGFLPGNEEEKMNPWMGALEDNLDVLNTSAKDGNGDWKWAAANELIRSRLKVKSLNFMRGRTFLNKFVIIDEAQNLTPKQMKTLITRAGPGTKVVCLGNIAQIDTPYLSEGSSGLTYVVDRFKGWPHSGHITLARGERSRLADHAAEVL